MTQQVPLYLLIVTLTPALGTTVEDLELARWRWSLPNSHVTYTAKEVLTMIGHMSSSACIDLTTM